MNVDAVTVEIAKLSLNEGDKIVIKTERVLNRQQAEAMRSALKDAIAGHQIIILDGGIDIAVLSAETEMHQVGATRMHQYGEGGSKVEGFVA